LTGILRFELTEIQIQKTAETLAILTPTKIFEGRVSAGEKGPQRENVGEIWGGRAAYVGGGQNNRESIGILGF